MDNPNKPVSYLKSLRGARGWTQEYVAELLGYKNSSNNKMIVMRHETWKTKVSAEDLLKYAKIYGVPVETIIEKMKSGEVANTKELEYTSQIKTQASAPPNLGIDKNKKLLFVPPTIDKLRGEKNMPVFGKLRAGFDGYEMLADPIDWIEPPEYMINRDGCFAMLVVGDSMRKAVPSGSMVFVDPYKPYKPGNLVMIVTKDNLGYIKRFISKNNKEWIFEQDQPEGEFVLDASIVENVYNVRGSNYDG